MRRHFIAAMLVAQWLAIEAGAAAPLSISTDAVLPQGTVSAPYSFALAAKGGIKPYKWSITAGALPPGLTMDASGVLSGAPTTAGSFNFSAKVTDNADSNVTKAFTLAIRSLLQITSTSPLPPGSVGAAYSQKLTATGGTPPYLWVVASGSLPAGLSLNPSTGTIAGTVGSSGTFAFTVRVTDSNSAAASQAFSLTIAAPPLQITTQSPLPSGTVGTAYSQTFSATGGTAPYSWSFGGGTLPLGLTFDAARGAISGTPFIAGTTNFTIQVTDSTRASALAKFFTLTINVPALIITTASLPVGAVGAPYFQTLSATGGSPPYAWSISSGSLPSGFRLDASSGTISGTPAGSGTFQFSVRVRDGSSTNVTKTFSLTILAAPLTVSPDTLPDATAGIVYSVTLTVSGGTPPYTWFLVGGSLPPGLLLSPSSGIISGTPTATGTFPFTIRVSDSGSGSAAKNLSITVRGSSVGISTSSLAGGQVGAAYSQTLSATGGVQPYQWSIANGALPQGLSLNRTTGVISGTPAAADNSAFVVQVTDNNGNSATQQFSITVTSGLAITSSAQLPAGAVSSPYSQTLNAAGGVPPYRWTVSAGSLPPGLALNPATGEISGTSSGAGNFAFSIQVADAASHTATQTFNLTIASGLAITNDSQLPAGSLNSTYSQSLNATGGQAPYSWVVINGLLPPGITLGAGSGTLSGTPNSIGRYSFTIQVTDASAIRTQKDFTLQVASPAIPTVTLDGVSDNGAPAQQTAIDIHLSAAYPTTLSGEITAAFEPDAVVPVDDQAIQFTNGGRSASFTIPAKTTQAVFTTSQMALQTGTVAGVITLTVTVSGSGGSANGDVGPTPVTFTRTIRIARSAPLIRSIALSKTDSGFQVQITGFSTDRDVTEADVHFNSSALGNLQTTNLTVKVADAASQWFKSTASAQYGSQFSLVLPFSIQGSTDSVGSVSVQLKNTQGPSNTSSASF